MVGSFRVILSEARMNLLTVTIYIYNGVTRSTVVKACIPSTAAPPHRYYRRNTSASLSARVLGAYEIAIAGAVVNVTLL